MSLSRAKTKAIKALPRACDDSLALNSPQHVRADCIAHKYIRRCEGSRFFNDPLCTSLGHQRPGFAFACINDFCAQSAPGSSKCNDWMNYIQMIANGPRDDAKAVSSLRATIMGSEHFDKENEEAGLRAFWFTSQDASVGGGRVCNEDIDGTVGGRVPSNAKDKYDINVEKDGVFYPVAYDKVMRSSRVCGTGQRSASQNPDEVWGAPASVPLGTVMESIFGQRQYHVLEESALASATLTIGLKHAATVPKTGTYPDDIVSIIKPDMSDDASLPTMRLGDNAVVSPDGKTLTLRLDSATVEKVRSGAAFILFRHGGGCGCRCLLTPSTVSLASDSRVPYRKECIYGFCDTTHVGEIRVSSRGSKSTVHYPRRDYLSARDGTFVRHLSTSPPCATSITICETELDARSIVMDKQSRIVNQCGSGQSPQQPSSRDPGPQAPEAPAGPPNAPSPAGGSDSAPTHPAPAPAAASSTSPFSIFNVDPSSSAGTADRQRKLEVAAVASSGLACVFCVSAVALSAYFIMRKK